MAPRVSISAALRQRIWDFEENVLRTQEVIRTDYGRLRADFELEQPGHKIEEVLNKDTRRVLHEFRTRDRLRSKFQQLADGSWRLTRQDIEAHFGSAVDSVAFVDKLCKCARQLPELRFPDFFAAVRTAKAEREEAYANPYRAPTTKEWCPRDVELAMVRLRNPPSSRPTPDIADDARTHDASTSVQSDTAKRKRKAGNSIEVDGSISKRLRSATPTPAEPVQTRSPVSMPSPHCSHGHSLNPEHHSLAVDGTKHDDRDRQEGAKRDATDLGDQDGSSLQRSSHDSDDGSGESDQLGEDGLGFADDSDDDDISIELGRHAPPELAPYSPPHLLSSPPIIPYQQSWPPPDRPAGIAKTPAFSLLRGSGQPSSVARPRRKTIRAPRLSTIEASPLEQPTRSDQCNRSRSGGSAPPQLGDCSMSLPPPKMLGAGEHSTLGDAQTSSSGYRREHTAPITDHYKHPPEVTKYHMPGVEEPEPSGQPGVCRAPGVIQDDLPMKATGDGIAINHALDDEQRAAQPTREDGPALPKVVGEPTATASVKTATATEAERSQTSFEGSAWVSTTDIIDVLSLLAPRPFMLNCSLLTAPPENMAVFSLRRPRKRLPPATSNILFPIWHAQHYSLVHVDIAAGCIKHYDSLLAHPGARIRDGVISFMDALGEFESTWRLRKWRFEEQPCARQINSDDCGVHVVVNALHLCAAQPIPLEVNTQLWRLILHACLARADNCAIDSFFGKVVRPSPAVELRADRGEETQLVAAHASREDELVTELQTLRASFAVTNKCKGDVANALRALSCLQGCLDAQVSDDSGRAVAMFDPQIQLDQQERALSTIDANLAQLAACILDPALASRVQDALRLAHTRVQQARQYKKQAATLERLLGIVKHMYGMCVQRKEANRSEVDKVKSALERFEEEAEKRKGQRNELLKGLLNDL